jgi:hypothetical protein
MEKLINLIIAGVIFWVVYFFLVPLLPAPASTFVGVIVVICAIVYLLGELGGYSWPWKK